MMLPMKHWSSLMVNPDSVHSVRAFKMKRLGDEKHKAYTPSWFGKLLGFKPRRAYRSRAPESVGVLGRWYQDPKVEFQVGKDTYTLTCNSNDQAFKTRDEIVAWLNEHQTVTPEKWSLENRKELDNA